VPKPSFVRFLCRSLAVLDDELPRAYRAVADRLGRRSVAIRVDDEFVFVSAAGGRVHVSLVLAREPSVHLHTSRGEIRALVDGRRSLLDAMLEGRLELRGTVSDLIAFDGALMAYLHGAVRCPHFIELRDEYFKETPGRPTGAPAEREATEHVFRPQTQAT